MATMPQTLKPKGLADFAKPTTLAKPITANAPGVLPAKGTTPTPVVTPTPKGGLMPSGLVPGGGGRGTGAYTDSGITPPPMFKGTTPIKTGTPPDLGITPLPKGEYGDMGITPLPKGEGTTRGDNGITPIPRGEDTEIGGDWRDTRVPGDNGGTGDGITPPPRDFGFTPRVNGPAPVLKDMPTGSSANLPTGQSNPTMQARTDAPAPTATARSYEQWAAQKAAEIDDSVANKLNAYTSQDSPLMQQARTDGIRLANSRGLGNSSMAVGAAQDAMVRNALPIAAQDASQAFQKNMQGRDYQYALAGQFAGQEFAGDQAAQDRALDVKMQNAALNAADQQQINDIRSREGVAAAERALQTLMQERDITFQGNENALNRDLEQRMQNTALDAADRQQIRDIESREGTAAAERALQLKMQGIEIDAQDRQQLRDIQFQSGERQKDREMQKWLAETNLDASDRNAAAQFITNMETMYQTSYQSIMANTALSAEQRTQQLQAAARLRDQQLDFVRQMYDIDLQWGMAPDIPDPGTPSPDTPDPTKPPGKLFPSLRDGSIFVGPEA